MASPMGREIEVVFLQTEDSSVIQLKSHFRAYICKITYIQVPTDIYLKCQRIYVPVGISLEIYQTDF